MKKIIGAGENTVSSEIQNAEAESIGTETEVTPQTEEVSAEQEAAQTDTETSGVGSGTEETPFLTVKYNHEEKELTQEEARNWAQKGMHYDALRPKIEYLAAVRGVSIEKLLSGLISEYEEGYKNELLEKLGEGGESVTEDMLALHRAKLGAEYQRKREEEAEAARLMEKDAGNRLSDEFNELRRDFPELSGLDFLPEDVKNAVRDGKPLLDAYLCYKHTEAKRIAAEVNRAKAVSQKTVGSMSTSRKRVSDSESRYLNALWGK
jgi:hypothetical protein